MKRVRYFLSIISIVLVGLPVIAVAQAPSGPLPSVAASSKSSPTRFIELKSVQLRVAPQHWSNGVERLQYGDKISILEEQGAWTKVLSAAQNSGFVHSSAYTDRRIVLQGSGKSASGRELDVLTDSSDVVLAGKGFAEDTETELQSDRKDLNFGAVDLLQTKVVAPADLKKFLTEGGLALNGDV